MGFNILDKDGNHIGWAASDFDNGSDLQFVDDTLEIAPDIDALKTNKVEAIKQQASQLLADTEWQLQRAQERDALGMTLLESEAPKAILLYREAVRRASNRAETELNKLSAVNTINAYTWQVEPTDYTNTKALTHIEFLRKFTSDERIAIATAAQNNAAINDYMAMLNAANFVNLQDDDVTAGISTLEHAGIIASGRASEILTADKQ